MKNKLINFGFMSLFIVAAVVLVLYGIKIIEEASKLEMLPPKKTELNSKQKGLMTGLLCQETLVKSSSAVVSKSDGKLIKNAEIRFQVRSLTKSRAAIEKLIKGNGGYLACDEQHKGERQIENTLTIRIPAARFDPFLQALKGQALYLDSQTIAVNDVTAEFIDNEARLKAKRKLEQRYMEILRQAGSVKEVLEVETRLGAVREEIEAIEGKLKYLQDQVAYSTIILRLYQPVPQALRPDRYFGKQLSQALVNGWKGFLAVSIALASVWPLLIMVAVIWLIIRWNRLRNLHQG